MCSKYKIEMVPEKKNNNTIFVFKNQWYEKRLL